MRMLKYIGAIVGITLIWLIALIMAFGNGWKPSTGLIIGIHLPFTAIIIYLAIKSGLQLKQYNRNNEQ